MLYYNEKEIGDWTIRDLLAYFKQGFSVTIKDGGAVFVHGSKKLNLNNTLPYNPNINPTSIPAINLPHGINEPNYSPYDIEPCRSCPNNPKLQNNVLGNGVGDSPCQFCSHYPYKITCDCDAAVVSKDVLTKIN